jgi:hypothetical protein
VNIGLWVFFRFCRRLEAMGANADGGCVASAHSEAALSHLDNQRATGAQHSDPLARDDAQFAEAGSQAGGAGHFDNYSFGAWLPFGKEGAAHFGMGSMSAVSPVETHGRILSASIADDITARCLMRQTPVYNKERQ